MCSDSRVCLVRLVTSAYENIVGGSQFIGFFCRACSG